MAHPMLSNAAYLPCENDCVMVQEGTVYLRGVKMTNVNYCFRAHSAAQTTCAGCLIDGGANAGGWCGSDVLILPETGHYSNVAGITNIAVTDLPSIVQAAGLIQSFIGPIIGIFHQYASIKDEKSAHSCMQL
ncbi:hypothetical protein MHU86_24526 [Fragilaria crotonensis]|nr:hypothetical protein MHU86_24526 [Fragilaria crotonensis]